MADERWRRTAFIPHFLISGHERAPFPMRQTARIKIMKTFTKFAIGTAMACGLAVAAVAPAAAQVGFGFGVAPVAPAYPSCYDGYGNYIYSYPYCAYTSPAYVEPYVGVGLGWGGGYWGARGWGGGYGHGFAGYGRGGYGHGFADYGRGGYGGGGRMAGGFGGGHMGGFGGGHVGGFTGGHGGGFSGGHGGDHHR
jgi:hypothetical protein